MKRTEAWIASAIVALSFTAAPARAQDGFFDSLLRRSNNAKSSAKTAKTAKSDMADAADDADAATPAETEYTIVDTRKIFLVSGQTKTIAFPEWIKRVEIGNDKVANANVSTKNYAQLILSGIAPGVTEIVVIDKEGDGHRLEIMVTPDASALKITIANLFPDANVEVIPAGDDGVALVGYVDNAQAITDIMAIAERFYPGGVINGLKVIGTQQVQLKVLIAEVSRTKLRALGVNFLHHDHNTYLSSTVGGLASITSILGVTPSFSYSPDNNFLYGRISNGDTFRVFIRALKQEGLVKIMAEPTLVTFSGRAAEMIVGGEFPIIVPGQQGTFTVEFREYGNRLNFVPIVLGNGRIRLEVRPELSQLDYANGVVFGGFTIPGLQQRRVETSVELNTGETFVIGGLLNTTDSATTNKVPYLGDMPLIGTAFRTVEYQQEEKELVIMVTPELTEPLKANQKLCGYPGSESTHPSNHELYLGGRFESPVCNDCESARRHELGVEIAHAQTARPGRVTKTIVTNSATAENSGRANTTAQQLAVPEQQPSEAQRPANLPGLLGPLGYDAGR